MMKILKITIVFLVTFNMSAQDMDLPKGAVWHGIEYQLSKEKKMELLSDVNEDLFYYLKDNELLETNIKNFHFLDLNGDKILDFIYVGYAGGEQPSTIAFTQNEKGYFKRVFETIGVIYEVNNISLVEGGLIFKVVKNDECYDCLGVSNSITYLSNKSVFTEVERLNFTENTEIPKIIFRKQFKVINPKCYLRSKPVVDNDGTQPDVLFGNVVAEYGLGTQGYAFASKEDDTGLIWWFVAVKYNESIKAIFQEKKGYNLGWMSSRYLKE